jgi:hypothetical protein
MRPLLPLLAAPVGLLPVGLAWLGQPGGVLALGHLAGAVVTGLLWRHSFPHAPLIAARAATLALGLPLFGPLAAWLCHPSEPDAEGELIESYRQFIAYQSPPERTSRLADAEEALRRELSVRPLVEVLAKGDLAAKQGAADALAALGGRSSVGVLRAALLADDDETRLFASLALGKLEEVHTRDLAGARAAAVDGGPAGWLALAETARRYAESGLPEGEARTQLWQEVESAAARTEAAPSPAERARGWRLRAAARLALEDPRGAAEAARAAIAVDPDELDARYMLCEALFAAGELDELRVQAEPLADRAQTSSPAQLVGRYWSDDHGR